MTDKKQIKIKNQLYLEKDDEYNETVTTEIAQKQRIKDKMPDYISQNLHHKRINKQILSLHHINH